MVDAVDQSGQGLTSDLDSEDISAIALFLLSSRENDELICEAQALPPLCDVRDVYAIHTAMTKVSSTLGAVVGWKVGACGKDLWEKWGLTEPFRAPLFEARVLDGSAGDVVVDMERSSFIVLEAEFGFVMGQSLPPRTEGAYSVEEVWAAVQWVVPAIEVVALRWSGEAKAKAQPLQKLADCGLNDCAVLGVAIDARACPSSLDQVKVKFAVDGELASEGSGLKVLGHPVRSLAWLANDLNKAKISSAFSSAWGDGSSVVGLRAGDFIMSGAAAVLHRDKARPGAKVEAIFEGLLQSPVGLTVQAGGVRTGSKL